MSKWVVNLLFFLGGVLVHLVYSTIYLTPPIGPTSDFNFKLSSNYLNENSHVCRVLIENGCGCNLVIETDQKCQAVLEKNISNQIKDELWNDLVGKQDDQ